MAEEAISIRTTDGECPAYIFTPDRSAARSAVIFYMDGFGLRPALMKMAGRLADKGYTVLLPDMFYRFGPYGPFDPTAVLGQDFHAILGPLMATTDNRQAAKDSGFFLDYLISRDDVLSAPVGVIGFCMGGGIALTVAGAFPERVAAAASFHGGNLANDAPQSPHLLAERMRGEIYVAGADMDSSYPPEMAKRLAQAMTEAGVTHRCEVYENALHGWMMPDLPIFDPAAAARGWHAALALFERNLSPVS